MQASDVSSRVPPTSSPSEHNGSSSRDSDSPAEEVVTTKNTVQKREASPAERNADAPRGGVASRIKNFEQRRPSTDENRSSGEESRSSGKESRSRSASRSSEERASPQAEEKEPEKVVTEPEKKQVVEDVPAKEEEPERKPSVSDDNTGMQMFL